MFDILYNIFNVIFPIYRSNPGTPTQPRRPDFISVNSANTNGNIYYDFPMMHHDGLPPQHPYHQSQQHQILPITHSQNGSGAVIRPQSTPYHHGGSPQRRFLSESELVRQGNELSYARSNNTVDNIRELAGSPQRGVYMWKDTSPGYSTNTAPQLHHQQQLQQPQQQAMLNNNYQQMNRQQQSINQYENTLNQQQHHRSNPTSPTQQMQQYNNVMPRFPALQTSHNNMSGGNSVPSVMPPYHPALRGGIPVFPPQPSPQTKRKATPTRPISFVRALEMTDSMEMTTSPKNGTVNNLDHQNQFKQSNNSQTMISGNGNINQNLTGVTTTTSSSDNNTATTTSATDRASVYDMSYEISV